MTNNRPDDDPIFFYGDLPDPYRDEPRVLLSVEEAAEALGLGRTSVYSLIKSGHIESVKVGRRRCIPVDVIEPYLQGLAERQGSDVAEYLAQQRQARENRSSAGVGLELVQIQGPGVVEQEDPDVDISHDLPGNEPPKRRRKRPEGTRAPDGTETVYYSEADGYWHGWVNMGIRDDGRPDRRHRMNRDETKLRNAVRELLNQRDQGNVVKIGPDWTVEKWLRYWLEEIAKPKVRYKGYVAYRTAVNVHLVPGLGAHKLKKIQPEHFERFYKKKQASGLKPATVHQIHRTARTAFGVAYKRGYVSRNVVELADGPRLEEEEVPALEVSEMKAVIAAAMRRRGGIRYVLALVLGYRQGESLGLEWSQLDRSVRKIKVQIQLQRQTWEHGCADPHACGERLHKRKPCPKSCKRHTRECPLPCPPTCVKHASSCPQRHGGGLVMVPVKSKAGNRDGALPDTAYAGLMAWEAVQQQERATAGTLWEDHGLMFCQPNGRPIDPSADRAEWYQILTEAGMPEERLHAARHSFATLLGELDVTDRTTQAIMGWSDASQAKRYQKVRDVVLRAVADKVEDAIWGE
ncbi:excisionase family DNA-binding protein [Catenulispora sp. NF23]|uniref:excisionase family DNA-binding protein n=1 Tax=Catenulispora pinistramenti TaxID=2705254 RepID=UPI001BA4EEE6|nr:excisionase family DNA-binding protein [Catenulispora pinistramenti]MBS2533753.1 excisionase family DNA-binding protein [Catenulispora pinistramenti]